MKSIYVTTPIFYPNDKLHLGHAYTMIVSDTIVRYKKSRGYSVYFQTGSDDHGEKIEKKSFLMNISPKKLTDKNILFFQQLWNKLKISKFFFFRTSSNIHKQKVQRIFNKLKKKGDIYKGKYKGKYCTVCEDYISGKENICTFCGFETYYIEEDAYFLKVKKYSLLLKKYYKKNTNFFLPLNIVKSNIENFLSKDIRDLCITRQDVKWAIKVPNNSELTIYVWFDALCNYITSNQARNFFVSLSNRNIEEFILLVIHKKKKKFLLFYEEKERKWKFLWEKLNNIDSFLKTAEEKIYDTFGLEINFKKKKKFHFLEKKKKFHYFLIENFKREKIKENEKTIFLDLDKIEKEKLDIISKNFLEIFTSENKKKEKKEIIQIIGKDIARFHGIHWLIILKSLGVNFPSKILSHGWILSKENSKMSKSKGNIIDPLKLLEKYSCDTLRAYLIAKINFLDDGIFSEELMIDFHQYFLKNKLGNLVARINKMVQLYNEGEIPNFNKKNKSVILNDYRKFCLQNKKKFIFFMENYQLTKSFHLIIDLVEKSNKIITDLKPWKEEKKSLFLKQILNHLANGLKIISFFISFFLPETSKKIFELMGIKRKEIGWKNIINFGFINKTKIKKKQLHIF